MLKLHLTCLLVIVTKHYGAKNVAMQESCSKLNLYI